MNRGSISSIINSRIDDRWWRFANKLASLIIFLSGFSSGAVVAQTENLVPLIDLGARTYKSFEGGLYSNGENSSPATHFAAALQSSEDIVPRNERGEPDLDGWIVLMAFGMSNTTHEFATFERIEDMNTRRNARVVIINGGVGGQTAAILADPDEAYWSIVEDRLAVMGLSPRQVQAAWLKDANAQPPDNFPTHTEELRDDLADVVRNIHDKFENVKICYVSSRSYGGYSQGALNPEPQAYESGFAVKWLIESQINGDESLNYDPSRGTVRSPLLLWGPYLWANGTTPRSDGLSWKSSDFEADGVHPTDAGERKVADLLSEFCASDESTTSWYLAESAESLYVIDSGADASVRADRSGSNFGSSEMLTLRGGESVEHAYIRFDLGAVPRPIALAKLSLRVSNVGGGKLYRASNERWSESTISFNRAPELTVLIAELPEATRDGTISVDVTEQLEDSDLSTVTFVLTGTDDQPFSYDSRESGDAPRLVIVSSGEPPTVPGFDGWYALMVLLGFAVAGVIVIMSSKTATSSDN